MDVAESLPFWNDDDECGGLASLKCLSGGQQNSNFKVQTTSGAAFVCRVPGVDAQEHGQSHQTVFDNSVAAHAVLGVAPRPRWFDRTTGVMVTEFVHGETLTVAALADPAVMAAVVATLRRGHESTAGTAPALTASPASDFLFGYSLDLLAGWQEPEDIDLIRSLQRVLQSSLGTIEPLVSCHNDLCPANMLLTGGAELLAPLHRIQFIDWEWSGPGDRLADLATLCFFALSEEDDAGELAVLAAYRGVPVSACSAVDCARLRLWRTWFALRGALWARRKEMSPHFANGPTGPDDDYHAFAEWHIVKFLDLLRKKTVATHMDTLAKAVASL
jgi:Ser/Thr protein kinase RdoA (MazF antagonist)